MSTKKVALVTGSSRGIGAAVAEALSDAGYAVCINYLEREDKAEELAAKLRQKGGLCSQTAAVSGHRPRDLAAALCGERERRFPQRPGGAASHAP